MDVKQIADWLTVAGWFIAGAWFIRQHLFRREDHARIDLTASMRLVTESADHRVVEVIAEVENTGAVRHYIRRLAYTIRGSDMEELRSEPDLLDQVELPIVVARNRPFFPREWVYSFVDAGQKSTYRHLVLVPREVRLVQLAVRMGYEDEESDFHTAVWFGTL